MNLALDPSERSRVLAAQRGDESAWAALVGEHGPTVYALCRRLDADPDDAYQAIWEKLVRSLDRFEPDGRPLRSWILTIAHRALVDRHRRARVRRIVVPLAEPPEAVTPAVDSAERLDRDAQAGRLERALHRLPEAQRRAVVLHHVHGLSLPEIAGAEGVPLGTLKSRLHRARERLQGLLASEPRS